MKRLKLTIQYDGSGLHGWQHQTGMPTVEGHLMEAWEKLTGETVDFAAAGRTDAGVHALGMVVHVDTDWAQAVYLIKVWDGLNHHLPRSVRVLRVAEVDVVGLPSDQQWHARYWGVARHYEYVLYNARVMRPDWFGRAGHARRPLDMPKMARALEMLPLGETDFSAYRDAECQSKTPMCNLLKRELTWDKDGFVRVRLSANKFLHHMVRNIMGTLVAVGESDIAEDELVRVLATRDRREAGVTFSPDGLYFLQVDYRPHTELAAVGDWRLG